MKVFRTLILILLAASLSGAAYGETRISVLDFELNDITTLPNTPAEKQRTASMAPMLAEALSRTGDYRVIPIADDAEQAANGGFGYLFRFHDEAAKLAETAGSDWLVVGQHSKPSFLFSYLWVYLIDVHKQKAVARYDIELKGNHRKVTEHAIDALAGKIRNTIAGSENGRSGL